MKLVEVPDLTGKVAVITGYRGLVCFLFKKNIKSHNYISLN